MADLFEVISPHLLSGGSLGRWHTALASILVSQQSPPTVSGGVVTITGIVTFNPGSDPWIDPSSLNLGINARNVQGSPSGDRLDPWIEFSPLPPMEFIFTAPQAPGPSSQNFILDLKLTSVTMPCPKLFLIGATLNPNSRILTRDPVNVQVKFTLPPITVHLEQGPSDSDSLEITLVPSDNANLVVTMLPQYAFIGPSECVGFGFQSATLDISAGLTPSNVLADFGLDSSWTGLYIPQIRLFVLPDVAEDLAIDGSAFNLLIGFGASSGVNGDFSLDMDVSTLPPTYPQRPPSWFRQLGANVRIVKNHIAKCEVSGKFNIQTAIADHLAVAGISGSMPQVRGLGSQNLSDGIINVRTVIQIDNTNNTVTLNGYFGADPADRDGLLMTGTFPGEPQAECNTSRNFLGLVTMFMPLLTDVSTIPGNGGLVELGITPALLSPLFPLAQCPADPTTHNLVTVERIIWYGGEIHVDGSQAIVMLDLEAAISADVGIDIPVIGNVSLIKILPNFPLAVRYKAVGLRIGKSAGQPEFQFQPMFDSSKGYTIDASRPGIIQVAPPLDKILKVLGAQISRTNPLLVEIGLGFAVDLGVVSIDRASIRLNIDNPNAVPELTAFGATIDIPGVLNGRGYLKLDNKTGAISGQIDLTLVSLQLRVAAGISINHIPTSPDGQTTAVLVTLDIDFPVAIPLATSGLGIYGMLGLFAMNYEPDDGLNPSPSDMIPALTWLKKTWTPDPTHGIPDPKGPTDIRFWEPKIGAWSFGVGAILGTMGSSFILNLKGIILLEMPGPRLLLMMKANVLASQPGKRDASEGQFLAVIDLDFGRGTLTVGLSIDYNDLKPLLQITIPVEAFFDFNDTSDWHLYLGKYNNEVRVKVLGIDASGYLMLSGSGIPPQKPFPETDSSPFGKDLPAVRGFSIAAGLYLSFKWGLDPLLFVEVAAGFDAVLGFNPFRMGGMMALRGRLHLFIVDISAWASLTVAVADKTNIYGKVCGRVKFLFVKVEGCVDFNLGDSPTKPTPPDLVTSLKLISRSPALVTGTGTDMPIDTIFRDGAVPINCIPVLKMVMQPMQDPGLQFQGETHNINNYSPPPGDGYVQSGDYWFRYTITDIQLTGPLTAGKTPATWWPSKSGDSPLECELALLSWVPEPAPQAICPSAYLDNTIIKLWGTVCQPVADATPVFWTFIHEKQGFSPVGWKLTGTAWPDPADTNRSASPDLRMRVTERWRCGDPGVDTMRGIFPAMVREFEVTDSGVLTSPIWDDGNIVAFGDRSLESIIQAGWTIQDYSPSRLLDDAVVFETGEFKYARFLIWVRSYVGATKFIPDGTKGAVTPLTNVKVSVTDANDNIFEEYGITSSDIIGPSNPLPSSWNDPIGPWQTDIAVLNAHLPDYEQIFFEIQGGLGADRIQIGLSQLDSRARRHQLEDDEDYYYEAPLFIIGAVEVLRKSELDRRAYDITVSKTKQETLKNALSSDSSDIALLKPGTSYQVQVSWKVEWEQRPPGQKPIPQNPVPPLVKTQSFQFMTDTDPPTRLDPWVLITLPGKGEQHFFASHAISVVFSTNNIELLYGTYGKKLQARIRPSSSRSVQPIPSAPHPYPIRGSFLYPIEASVLSPWENAAQDLVRGNIDNIARPCVTIDKRRIRHSMITIPIPLDLDTDYLLDIEMLDVGAPDGSQGTTVWQQSFSTGYFRTLEDFANSFTRGADIKHRGVFDLDKGRLQFYFNRDFSSRYPEGAEFDHDITLAGLDLQPPVRSPQPPRIVVFWDPPDAGNQLPQPAAILIDSPEPMWRERPFVTLVKTDPGDPKAQHYELLPAPWLKLEAQGDPIVENIVPAPGGQRALVTLKPTPDGSGPRGKHVILVLHQFPHPADPNHYIDISGFGETDKVVTILDLTLTSAPWEEG